MMKSAQRGEWISGIRLESARAFASSAVALALMLVGLAILATQSAQAQAFSVLYSFTGSPDGAYPYAGLVPDAKGNLYGTTSFGGASNYGTVFKLNSKDKETVLLSFAGGGYPYDALLDVNGQFYGTTYSGGASNFGTVFKVDASGKETVLHSFAGSSDGEYPFAGLVRDAKGNFYGVTTLGGRFGNGVVFKVDKAGKETLLYTFTGGADGGNPFEGLIRDAKGNLYGTTEVGGTSGLGTVYKVNSKGKETVLHSFAGGANGRIPFSALIRDTKGNFYGTTEQGGDVTCNPPYGCGTVFKLIP